MSIQTVSLPSGVLPNALEARVSAMFFPAW